MKALIFGHNGQDGFYLKKMLDSLSFEVYGVSKSTFDFQCDLSNFESVFHCIKSLRPNYIFHLAAISKTSHDTILENQKIISQGTLNILESLYLLGLETKVFITGSGLQFVNERHPIKETDLFEPRDCYSMSRIHSVYTARYYRSMGLPVYVGYLYHHDSPFRSEDHMTSKIFYAAKRISNGSNEKLEIRDLTAIKEYGFAGDIVEGIWTLVNQSKAFEANIGTGEGHSISDWANLCFSSFGLKLEEHLIHSKANEQNFYLVSDTTRINKLGWFSKTNLVNLLQTYKYSL